MGALPPLTALVDLVIAFTVVEGLLLIALHRATGRGVAPSDFVANMASGLALMLALRFALHDAGTAAVAGCLLLAGVAHGFDLWRRRKGRGLAGGQRAAWKEGLQ